MATEDVTVTAQSLTPPENGSSVTIGTFDGVHVGHRSLIDEAKRAAAEIGTDSVVVTWDRHPFQTIRPAQAPPLLSTPERRLELLNETGIDWIALIRFDEELSKWPPERFVEEVLAAGLAARWVVVGQGWRFGHKAAGDVELLSKLGERFGFGVTPLGLAQVAGEVASSSRVRKAVGAGDMTLARTLLGRPFDLDGEVIHGASRGADLGFPTANVTPDPKLVRPPIGVYAGRARVGETWYTAAINLGVNPTFGGDPNTPPLVEAYLLDLDDDLYGQTLRVEFWERLRDEKKFDSADALVEQMKLDVEATRHVVP